jgi:hypothetical protein
MEFVSMVLKKPKYPVLKYTRSSCHSIHPDNNHHFFAGFFMKADGFFGVFEITETCSSLILILLRV